MLDLGECHSLDADDSQSRYTPDDTGVTRCSPGYNVVNGYTLYTIHCTYKRG